MAMHHHAHRVPYEQQVDACLIHLHCILMLLGPLTVVCPQDIAALAGKCCGQSMSGSS